MSNLTERAIKEAFIKLLGEKPLAQISVRMIVEECGINRNSFYYHFQDIPTLLGEIIREEVDRIITQYPTITSLDQCVDVALRFALANKRAVYHIYNSVSRDLYESALMKICEYLVTAYLDTAFGKGTVDEYDRAVIIRFTKCEIFGLACDWVENGMNALVAHAEKSPTNTIHDIGCSFWFIGSCATIIGLVPNALLIFGN